MCFAGAYTEETQINCQCQRGCILGARQGPNGILVKSWSLTSLQRRLVKTGSRLIKHACYCWLLLAEGHLNRRLFGSTLRRIWALPVPCG